MTAAEKLDALRRIAIKKPRISLTVAMRTIREKEAIRATTDRLRAEIASRRTAVRMWAAAGSTEGLC